MQWNTSLSPFPSEQKCQKATIRAGSNWQSQQGSKEIDRRGDAIPCLLWYLLQNFLQTWVQLLGHGISFASHPHQNPPHSNMVNQTLHWDVLPLSLPWLLLPMKCCCCIKCHTVDPYSWLIICNFKCLTPCQTHVHSGLKPAMAAFQYIYPFHCIQKHTTQLSIEL